MNALNHIVSPECFILRRRDQISRMCKKWSKDFPGEKLDFEQDVMTRIVARIQLLQLTDARNPESVISTWIGWQIRAVRTYYVRRRARFGPIHVTDDPTPLIDRTASPDHQQGQAGSLVNSTTARAILQACTSQQRQAVLLTLDGYSRSEMHQHFGVDPEELTNAFRKIRAVLMQQAVDRSRQSLQRQRMRAV